MSSSVARIPHELQGRRPWLAFFGCLYAVGLWVGSSLALYFLWQSSLPTWLIVALSPIPGLVGGYGILLCGFMGHDGTHFTLHSNKVVSSVIGILITCPITPYLLMGFTISHWNHHKFTNTELDPDARLFHPFRSFWTRALFARPWAFVIYADHCLRLAFGLPFRYRSSFPLPDGTARNLARFNIAANALAFLGHLTVLWLNPTLEFAVMFVFAFGSVVSGLSPYIEHTGTGQGRGRDTRTSEGFWLDVFLLGNNYHAEHHLFPTVPFYQLRKAHAHLRREGYFTSESHVSRGSWDTYRYTMGKYPYPKFESGSQA